MGEAVFDAESERWSLARRVVREMPSSSLAWDWCRASGRGRR